MKRLIIFFAAAAVCLGMHAQSRESDSLYVIGVNLYNEGKYAEAIPFFEKSRDLDYREMDENSIRREYSSTWLASCFYKLGDVKTAEQYDKYITSAKPVDRRTSFPIDNLLSECLWELSQGNFKKSISLLHKVSDIEHKLYDPDHVTHANTYINLAQCHSMNSEADSSLYYYNKGLDIYSRYFPENHIVYLDLYKSIYSCNISLKNYQAAREANDKARPIIKANLDEKNIENLEVAYKDLYSYICERNEKKVEEELPNCLTLIKYYSNNDPNQIRSYLSVLSDHLRRHNYAKQVELINKEILSVSEQISKNSVINAQLTEYSNAIAANNTIEAKSLEHKLINQFRKVPVEEVKSERALFSCFRFIDLMKKQRYDEAKELYREMRLDSLDQYTNKNDMLYPLFIASKGTIAIALMDFENGISAYQEAIDYVPKGSRDIWYIEAVLATLWGEVNENIKSKNALYSAIRHFSVDDSNLEKLDELIKSARLLQHYTHPRESIYNGYFLEAEFLSMKLKILKTQDEYLISSAYKSTMLNYASILFRFIKDSSKAISELENYYSALTEYFAENPKRILGKHFMLSTLQDLRDYYPKGSEQGIKAHKKYIAALKERDENSEQYREAVISYYQYTSQTDSLRYYLESLPDKSDSQVHLLAELTRLDNQDNQDFDLELNKRKLFEAIEQKVPKEDIWLTFKQSDITRSLSDIISDYASNGRYEELLDFYITVLWPYIENCREGIYLYTLIESIELLKYRQNASDFILNDLITAVKEEINTKGRTFKNPVNVAIIENSIGNVLYEHNKCSEAVEYIKAAYEKTDEGTDEFFYFACNLHDMVCNSEGMEALAFNFGHQLTKFFDKYPEYKQKLEYYTFLDNHTNLLFKNDNYEEVIRILHPLEEISSADDYSYHTSIYRLGNVDVPLIADISSKMRLRERLVKSHILLNNEGDYQALEDILKYVEYRFSNLLSESGKSIDEYINMVCEFACKFPSDSLDSKVYDALLYGKGLQLRSDIAFRDQIEKADNKSALRIFDEIRRIESQMPYASAGEFEELKQKLSDLERDLSSLSKEFSDYKKLLPVSWKEIQRRLTGKDLAIEFTYIDKGYSIPAGYYGCVLKKDIPPKLVFIAEAYDIDNLYDLNDTADIAEKLLSALSPFLSDVDNIYFSPAGKLNQIPVESLILRDGTVLSEKYSMYRLSSTRELLEKQETFVSSSAVVYGGIEYNCSVNELISEAGKYGSSQTRAMDLSDIRACVAGIPYLEGTYTEAQQISSTINERNGAKMHATPFVGISGTEASFKALNGTHTRLAHIATHGFYLEPEEATDVNILKKKNLSKADNSLLRSGLMFAGAENAFFGWEVPEGIDDGILTAHEISNIDLRGMDLVVLSACQTALGYTTSEGVFGLQRGFKKAGVNSILMSLWKVDDEATCFLMTEFYKHWTNGKTKNESLELAKHAVRSQDKWHNPKYWSGFILLDALN